MEKLEILLVSHTGVGEKIQKLFSSLGCNPTLSPFIQEGIRLLKDGLKCDAIVLDIELIEEVPSGLILKNEEIKAQLRKVPIIPFIFIANDNGGSFFEELSLKWRNIIQELGMLGAYDIVSRTPDELILVVGLALSQNGFDLPVPYKTAVSSSSRNPQFTL